MTYEKLFPKVVLYYAARSQMPVDTQNHYKIYPPHNVDLNKILI